VAVVPIGSAFVQRGATVIYEIRADDVADLAGAQATFTYDPTLWTVVGLGQDFDGCLDSFNNYTLGSLVLGLICSSGHTGAPLTLWSLILTADKVEQDRQDQLAVTQLTLADLAEAEIPAKGAALDVVITGVVCGDLHPAGGGDGDVDVLDALRTLKISVDLVTPDSWEATAGDVHPATAEPAGDGDIDVVDALRVLKDTVGLVTITSCGGPSP
jgi:hypothetical protein